MSRLFVHVFIFKALHSYLDGFFFTIDQKVSIMQSVSHIVMIIMELPFDFDENKTVLPSFWPTF